MFNETISTQDITDNVLINPFTLVSNYITTTSPNFDVIETNIIKDIPTIFIIISAEIYVPKSVWIKYKTNDSRLNILLK